MFFCLPWKIGEDEHFDLRIFFRWVGSTTNQVIIQPVMNMLLFRSFGSGSFIRAGGVVLSKHVWFFPGLLGDQLTLAI